MHRLSRVAPARQGGAQGRLAVVLCRARRSACWAQRLGQVDAAADHGRHRHGVPRRRRSWRPARRVGLLEQEPAARRVQGRARQRRGRRGRASATLLDRFNELSANYSEETADEFARLQEQIDAADAWNLDTTLDTAMDALRLPPGDADVTKLSGGERRRVALCRLLLRAPDLLLLDEPTNHLDAESVAWLERHLHEYKGTVVAVTHDRYFLDNVAGWILELDRGAGHPVRGQLLELAGAEAGSGWRRRTQDADAPAHASRSELEWVRMNAVRAPRQAQGAPEPLRGAAGRGAQRQARPGPDPHPAPARAWATSWSRPRGCARATATSC